jgi:Protein of unknown function (DUF3147)
MLAFPAILAASLTLIAEEEDRSEARECARGAVIGGLAMALFATVAAVSLGKLNGAIALLLAAVAWFAGALIGYAWPGSAERGCRVAQRRRAQLLGSG